MWIRSQNREGLIKANDIFISESNNKANICVNENIIVGTYETKERAIEVLNYIQNSMESITRGRTIYKMP